MYTTSMHLSVTLKRQRLGQCLQHGARAIAVSLYTLEHMEIA